MGANAYDIIMDYTDILDECAVVESGSCRLGSGEQSSTFFAGFIQSRLKTKFYTFDINEGSQFGLNRFTELMPDRYHVINGSFSEHVNLIKEPIAFAYIDSFDYIPPDSREMDWMIQMIEQYKSAGLELTNENSAKVHLEQTKLVAEKAASKCVILFDDTWEISTGQTFAGCDYYDAIHPDWYGKGATAVPWLLERGWKLIPKYKHDRARDDWTALCNW